MKIKSKIINIFDHIVKNLKSDTNYFILLIFIVLMFIGSISNPMYMTAINQKNIMLDFSVPFILSIGLTMVILIGGIDLSLGANISLSAAVVAFLLQRYGISFSIGITLLMGMCIGFFNGFFISRFKILPFIVTLSTKIMCEGIALFITHSQPIAVNNQSFVLIDSGYLFGTIPLPLIYSLVIFILAYILLNNHTTGRRIYQIGNDEETTRIAGVRVDRVKIGVYIMSGTIASFCGIILAARMRLGDPTTGTEYLFNSIASVCLGGTVLGGGQGGVIGTLGGVLLMLNLKNILILNNVSIYIQDMTRGAIILISLIIMNIRKNIVNRGK